MSVALENVFAREGKIIEHIPRQTLSIDRKVSPRSLSFSYGNCLNVIRSRLAQSVREEKMPIILFFGGTGWIKLRYYDTRRRRRRRRKRRRNIGTIIERIHRCIYKSVE